LLDALEPDDSARRRVEQTLTPPCQSTAVARRRKSEDAHHVAPDGSGATLPTAAAPRVSQLTSL
jgi:hypothetical protein